MWGLELLFISQLRDVSMTKSRTLAKETSHWNQKISWASASFIVAFFGHHKKVLTLKAKKKGPMRACVTARLSWIYTRDHCAGWSATVCRPAFKGCLQMGPWSFLETPPWTLIWRHHRTIPNIYGFLVLVRFFSVFDFGFFQWWPSMNVIIDRDIEKIPVWKHRNISDVAKKIISN